MKKQEKKGVVIYQAKSGAIELRGDFGKETVWATQFSESGFLLTLRRYCDLMEHQSE